MAPTRKAKAAPADGTDDLPGPEAPKRATRARKVPTPSVSPAVGSAEAEPKKAAVGKKGKGVDHPESSLDSGSGLDDTEGDDINIGKEADTDTGSARDQSNPTAPAAVRPAHPLSQSTTTFDSGPSKISTTTASKFAAPVRKSRDLDGNIASASTSTTADVKPAAKPRSTKAANSRKVSDQDEKYADDDDLLTMGGYTGALGDEEMQWAEVIKRGYKDRKGMNSGIGGGKGKNKAGDKWGQGGLGDSVKTIEVSKAKSQAE